jgi:putative aldouronate transport system permease protein
LAGPVCWPSPKKELVTILAVKKTRRGLRDKFELLDGIILFSLLIMAALIVFPLLNVLATSFASQKEAAETPLMLFPTQPTIDNYYRLFQDPRILIGYKTTLLIIFLGVPLNLFLTTSLAYGLSRTNFPGGKFIFYAVLLTMLFNGGIVPLYLLMLQLSLTKTIWSVILAYGVNTFYFIIMRTYMTTLPDSLIESAKIDGADEMRILFKIILPLSKPIIATVLLFYAVDRWNEWFNAMVFLRRNDLIPLQLVLRTIVMDSVIVNSLSIAGPRIPRFTEGIQTATIMVTMLPIMCFFPFLQKYFMKGIMIGAIKA